MELWGNSEIMAAWIQGGSAILSALIAALAASLIGKKFADQKSLREELEVAQADIQFLLEAEKIHCEIHKEHSGRSLKVKVREKVTYSTGLSWSGRFTPGRIRDRRSN